MPEPYQRPDANPPLRNRIAEREADLVADYLALHAGQIYLGTGGEEIIIVEHGRINRYDGPDIYGAIIAIDGRVCQGQVECHLRSADWFNHGHHTDDHYDQVILHVVRRGPGGPRPLPLPELPVKRTHNAAGGYCGVNSAGLIWNLSNQRWQDRIRNLSVANWQEDLPVQAMEVLGYHGNRQSFGLLARRAQSWPLLELSVSQIESGLVELMADPRFTWCKGGVRPVAHPRRRIPVAAGLLKMLAHWQNAAWSEESFNELFPMLVVPACGPGLVTELSGNVLIPARAVKALSRREFTDFEQLKADWQALRLPQIYGIIKRQFGPNFTSRQLHSFAFVQGLLQLRRQYCQTGRCADCRFLRRFHD